VLKFRRHARASAGSGSAANGPDQSSASTAPDVNVLIASIASQSGRTSRRRYRDTLTRDLLMPSATCSSESPRVAMNSDRCMPADVHPAHIVGQAFCTPDVVPATAPDVHAVYMARATAKKPAEPEKRWRETCIRHWRGTAGLTLEAVSELLAKPPYNLETGITHTSLQRVETGLQMPKVELIEALAHLYKTDVNSLLNELPTVPQRSRARYGDLADVWDRASPAERAKIIAIAKTVVEDE
jgi:transcriptional regulator with XRE-family HTH domain